MSLSGVKYVGKSFVSPVCMSMCTVTEIILGNMRLSSSTCRQTDVEARAGSHRRFLCPDGICDVVTTHQIGQIGKGQVSVQSTDTLSGNLV